MTRTKQGDERSTPPVLAGLVWQHAGKSTRFCTAPVTAEFTALWCQDAISLQRQGVLGISYGSRSHVGDDRVVWCDPSDVPAWIAAAYPELGAQA